MKRSRQFFALRVNRECFRIAALVPKGGVAVAKVIARGFDTTDQPAGVGFGDAASRLTLLAIGHGLREIVMNDRSVIRIWAVFVHDFPVACSLVDAKARDNLQFLRRGRDEDVDQRLGRTEMLAQTG